MPGGPVGFAARRQPVTQPATDGDRSRSGTVATYEGVPGAPQAAAEPLFLGGPLLAPPVPAAEGHDPEPRGRTRGRAAPSAGHPEGDRLVRPGCHRRAGTGSAAGGRPARRRTGSMPRRPGAAGRSRCGWSRRSGPAGRRGVLRPGPRPRTVASRRRLVRRSRTRQLHPDLPSRSPPMGRCERPLVHVYGGGPQPPGRRAQQRPRPPKPQGAGLGGRGG